MDFNSMTAEVLSIVKRPDKVADIRREINSAIRQFCFDCDFERDRVEQSVNIDANEYTQAILLSSLPRYRKMWYIKRGGTRKYLSPMDTAKMGRDDCDLRDKWYLAGTSINVSMTALASTMDIGFYQYPPTLTGTNTFWLSDMNPYMVVDWAAYKLWTSIGDMQSAQRHREAAQTAYRSLVADIGVKG